MSKIAVCYFSYWKDIPFLDKSLRLLENTIARHPEHEVQVFVFDDARCEKHIELQDLKDHKCQLFRTDFDRQGNLNGYECINGMFKIYLYVLQQKFPFDYVIKLDSDCVLNSFDYIYATEEEMKRRNVPLDTLGEFGSYFASICINGCCQTFGRAGVYVINNLFNLMNNPQNDETKVLRRRVELGYNEDKVVSVLMEMSPAYKFNIDELPNIKGNCNTFSVPEDTDYTEYTSVAFKPNVFADTVGWSREKCLDMMEKHVTKMCELGNNSIEK